MFYSQFDINLAPIPWTTRDMSNRVTWIDYGIWVWQMSAATDGNNKYMGTVKYQANKQFFFNPLSLFHLSLFSLFGLQVTYLWTIYTGKSWTILDKTERMRIFPRHQAPLIFQRLIKLDFLWKFMILEKTKRNLEKDFRAHTCSMKKLKLRTEWFDYSLILCITNTRIVLRLLIWISFFLHESLLTQLYRDL